MANIHPLLVHLPIGLFSGFVLAEALAFMSRRESLRQAASWMLYFGTLGAAVTVATGLWAANTVEHDDAVHAIMERHETYGIAVLATAGLLSLWRLLARANFSAQGRVIHFAGALGLMAMVTLGADLGGMMVYRYAVGVTTPASSSAGESSAVEATLPADDVAEPAARVLPSQPAARDTETHPHTHDHPHGHKHTHKH
jgi:uncharacterized membrane protein